MQAGRWIRDTFAGRAWIAVELTRGPDDRHRLQQLRAIGRAVGLPLIAAGDVHMHVRARRTLQDVVTAIRLGQPVAECGSALHPNGERHLRAIGRLAHLYPPELLLETLTVAERCSFSLDALKYEYPDELVPAAKTPASYLRRLTRASAQDRYPSGMPERVRAIVERELALIAELAYEPYFLTVHDVVRFARSRGILCQGRGSGGKHQAACHGEDGGAIPRCRRPRGTGIAVAH